MGNKLNWLQDKDSDSRFTSSMPYESQELELCIDNDGEPFDSGLAMMGKVIENLLTLDVQAKLIISKDLREAYNDGWREYDKLHPDGSYQTISNPVLNETEFIKQFSLEHIEVTGVTCLTFWYGQSDLFAGHSVFVQSFDGIDLTDAKAQMFG
jgi:hypothetical protein